MKILSWNVNGLRSVAKKGFLDWLTKANPDIVCLQEIKSGPDDLTPELLKPKGYESFFNPAIKKGYSGVAIYTKQKPLAVKDKLGLKRFDEEGRFLELKYSNFTLINLYLPHGGRQKEKLPYKLEVYRHLLKYLGNFLKEKLILTGDFNIAHQEIDLARPKQNKNNIMFTSKERKQIDKLVNLGFIDSFRKFHKNGGHYTWWPYSRVKRENKVLSPEATGSYFVNFRERNLGWRLDYSFVSHLLKNKIKNAFIFPQVQGSDHCPIGIEIVI